MQALWQLSVGGMTEGIPLLAQAEFNQQGKETLMFVPLLSQSFCTNDTENTVTFHCGTTTMSTDGCGPFTNYRSPQVSLPLHLNLVQHA